MPKTKKRSIYDRFTWHEDNDHCDATFFLLDRIGDAIYDPPTLPPQCVADAASALFGDAPGDFQRDSRAAFALHDIINAAIASTLMDLANGNQSAWDALRDRVEIDRSNRRREVEAQEAETNEPEKEEVKVEVEAEVETTVEQPAEEVAKLIVTGKQIGRAHV